MQILAVLGKGAVLWTSQQKTGRRESASASGMTRDDNLIFAHQRRPTKLSNLNAMPSPTKRLTKESRHDTT
jgi:hypothetical protein